MLDYHTPERIHEVLRSAEKHGINTFFGRTDDHIFKVLGDYWQEGGQIQWFAQVCIERGDPDAWRQWLVGAVELGCTGAYIHGGVVDNWHATERWDLFVEALGRMRDAGVVWSRLAPGDAVSVAVHPTNPDYIFAAVDGGLKQSRDGGTTWSALAAI